mmetsp:Transcript_14710/g.27677  ORF Transcript_14710/g.27677 Transcript_14710/m.27677 type:complete len:103 (-) Transcript_14710:686-994(-)
MITYDFNYIVSFSYPSIHDPSHRPISLHLHLVSSLLILSLYFYLSLSVSMIAMSKLRIDQDRANWSRFQLQQQQRQQILQQQTKPRMLVPRNSYCQPPSLAR